MMNERTAKRYDYRSKQAKKPYHRLIRRAARQVKRLHPCDACRSNRDCPKAV